MRADLLGPILAIALAAFMPGAAFASDTHVLVVSVDGLGASELFAKPSCLAEKSTIRALASKGAYSRGVVGVLPTITYPSHATIATGTLPTKHGVIDNGIGGAWFKERSNIQGDALWDAARKAGKSVAIVTWPSTYGAVADQLVPEDLNNHAVPTDDLRKGSTPGLFDALASAVGAPKLLPFSHAEAGTPLDEMTARFAAEVVRRHKPALLLTHFLDYDHRMHAVPYSDDACKSLERTDAWIAHLLEAYRAAGILDRTTVFVISDHGFQEVKKQVSIYGLLKDAGWEELFPGQDPAAAFKLKVAGGSVAFYPADSMPPDMRARVAARIKPRIEKKHGDVVRWISPAAAQRLGGFPGALFTLCARKGYSFALLSSARPELMVDPVKYRGAHGFCPDEAPMDATFIASGYGVSASGALGRMPMVDVGPTIAAFLGARLPNATGRDRSASLRSSAKPAPAR